MDAEDVVSMRYDDTYASMVEHLLARRREDPSFTIDCLRDVLKDAYVCQGNDWGIQGALSDATQAAIVAAYEVVLAEWQAEIETAT